MALRTDKERFFDKVSLPDENGCMFWRGSRYRNGYGKAYVSLKRRTDLSKTQGAHRLSYMLFNGVIHPGNVVMHTCDTPLCVAPGHLEQGTQEDNLNDMFQKGRWAPYEREKSDTCRKGHPLTDENVYRWGSNRYCRVCRLIRERSKFGVHPDKYRKEVPFS